MKLLLSADWHIKLGQKNVPRDWQKNRFKMFFDKIYKLENDCDIHIIMGDIFDTIASPEELAMYFDFVSGCKIPTFIFDGNHEALKKGKTFLKFLSTVTTNINSNVSIIDGITTLAHVKGDDKLSIDIIPYTHLKTFNPKDFHNRILCTHVRGNILPHVIEEIDLGKLEGWEVVLAGDLHSYSNSQENILYPGSPLSITFHRNKIDNGVIIFDTDDMSHEFIALGLPQLMRKTVSKQCDIIPTEYDHTIYEITGNLLELSDIDTTADFIDKKIVNKTTDSKLNLKGKTLVQELDMYLKEILAIESAERSKILKVYNDYSKEFEVE